MKRRIFQVFNFLAFNLLFFALYLNFIHKDNNAIKEPEKQQTHAVVKGNMLVENPEQYINKNVSNQKQNNAEENKQSSDALKLSFN